MFVTELTAFSSNSRIHAHDNVVFANESRITVLRVDVQEIRLGIICGCECVTLTVSKFLQLLDSSFSWMACILHSALCRALPTVNRTAAVILFTCSYILLAASGQGRVLSQLHVVAFVCSYGVNIFSKSKVSHQNSLIVKAAKGIFENSLAFFIIFPNHFE